MDIITVIIALVIGVLVYVIVKAILSAVDSLSRFAEPAGLVLGCLVALGYLGII